MTTDSEGVQPTLSSTKECPCVAVWAVLSLEVTYKLCQQCQAGLVVFPGPPTKQTFICLKRCLCKGTGRVPIGVIRLDSGKGVSRMKVRVTVFKSSGKYYTDEEIELPVDHHHEMVEYIRNLIAEKKIPGLVEGADEFHVLAVLIDENGDVGVPHLFLA